MEVHVKVNLLIRLTWISILNVQLSLLLDRLVSFSPNYNNSQSSCKGHFSDGSSIILCLLCVGHQGYLLTSISMNGEYIFKHSSPFLWLKRIRYEWNLLFFHRSPRVIRRYIRTSFFSLSNLVHLRIHIHFIKTWITLRNMTIWSLYRS